MQRAKQLPMILFITVLLMVLTSTACALMAPPAPSPSATLSSTSTPVSTNTPNISAAGTQIAINAQSVCLGKTLPQAAPFQRGASPHPFLVFGQVLGEARPDEDLYDLSLATWLLKTEHVFDDALLPFNDPQYAPKSVEELQVVVCLSYRLEYAGDCPYTQTAQFSQPKTYLVRALTQSIGVTVLEARSGNDIGTFGLSGGKPQCPATIDVNNKPDTLIGSNIDTAKLMQRLADSIDVPIR